MAGTHGGKNTPTPEELEITLRFVIVIVRNGLLDLCKLSLNPRIFDIAVSVEFGKRLQAFLSAAMIDEPTRTLREE